MQGTVKAPRSRDESFPKTERLLNRSEFLRVQNQGRKLNATDFLLFHKQSLKATCRIGFTVSKRVGKAVVRSRLKRVLREFYRKHKALFGSDSDWVIVAHASAAQRSTSEIFKLLEDALLRKRNSREIASTVAADHPPKP